MTAPFPCRDIKAVSVVVCKFYRHMTTTAAFRGVQVIINYMKESIGHSQLISAPYRWNMVQVPDHDFGNAGSFFKEAVPQATRAAGRA